MYFLEMFSRFHWIAQDVDTQSMPSSFYLYELGAGTRCARISELAAGTATSSVPVIIQVCIDMCPSWLQTPVQFFDNPFSTILNCLTRVSEETISVLFGIV